MNKLIIIEILLLYFTLTACFENKSNLYKKIEEVDYLIRNNQRDSAEKVFYSLDMTSAKESENALYNYNKLSPRYKIIIILEDMKKSIDEIKFIMSFEETSYYSAKSRINRAKK